MVRWVPKLELWPLHHKTFRLSKLDFIHSTDASYTFIPATASRIDKLQTQVPNSIFWMSKLDLWLLHVLHLKTNVCDCQSDILSILHETTLDSAGSKSVNKFTFFSLIMLGHLVVTLCYGCGEFHTIEGCCFVNSRNGQVSQLATDWHPKLDHSISTRSQTHTHIHCDMASPLGIVLDLNSSPLQLCSMGWTNPAWVSMAPVHKAVIMWSSGKRRSWYKRGRCTWRRDALSQLSMFHPDQKNINVNPL